MPGANKSYPPAILGRPDHGIPRLTSGTDQHRCSGSPAWWGSPQPGPKRRRLLTQAPRLAALAGFSYHVQQYDINLAGEMNIPALQITWQGEGIQEDLGRGRSPVSVAEKVNISLKGTQKTGMNE